MSQSNTPSRRYGDIIGSIFNDNTVIVTATGNGSGEQAETTSSSQLHNAIAQEQQQQQQQQYINMDERSFDEDAKACSKEHQQQQDQQQQQQPQVRTKSLSSNAMPERIQCSSAGGHTPERQSFTFRVDSLAKSQQSHAGSTATRKDYKEKEESSQRCIGKSPAKPRNYGEKSTSNNGRFASLRRFSISSGRKKDCVEATDATSSSLGCANSQPPATRRENQFFAKSSRTQHNGQRLPRSSSMADKDREILSLRKQLEDFQEHLSQVLATQEVMTKRMDKKQREAESASAAVEQLEKTVRVQKEQVIFYESCLRDKYSESEYLKRELLQKSKTISRLELELEVHDFKFGIYDDYRRLLDKQKINGKERRNNDEDEEEPLYRDFERARLNNQEQDFLSVIFKLDHVEKLFEQSLTESTRRYLDLYEDHKKALTRISILELQNLAEDNVDHKITSDQSSDKSVDVGSISSTAVTVSEAENPPLRSDPVKENAASAFGFLTVIELLEKRIALLEAENMKYSLQLRELREELEKSRGMQNDLTVFSKENELSILRLEKDALKKKISALETEIGFTSGQIDDKTRTRRYRALEKNLDDYIAEIMSLEDRLKVKDKVISTLKERALTRTTIDNQESSRAPDKLGTRETAKITSGDDPEGDVQGDEIPTSRLHEKVEKLMMKSKKIGQSMEATSSSSRIAMLRKRLNQIRANIAVNESLQYELEDRSDVATTRYNI